MWITWSVMPLSLINRNNGNGRLDILRRGTTVGGLTMFTSAISFDADASAFITAAGITNETQKSAINALVVDLKQYGLWSKMKAVYPFIGGTATTHKWNLKDPRDLDAAFRLTFSGGWTHNANGVTGNGSNSIANTFYNGFNQDNQDDWSRHVYSRTTTNLLTQIEIGAAEGANTTFRSESIGTRQTDGNAYHGDTASASNLVYANSNGSGLYSTVRRGANDTEAYKNGASQQIGAGSSLALPSVNIYIGARNYQNTTQFPTTRNLAFAAMGSAMTDTEAANLYLAVQSYQTTLEREV